MFLLTVTPNSRWTVLGHSFRNFSVYFNCFLFRWRCHLTTTKTYQIQVACMILRFIHPQRKSLQPLLLLLLLPLPPPPHLPRMNLCSLFSRWCSNRHSRQQQQKTEGEKGQETENAEFKQKGNENETKSAKTDSLSSENDSTESVKIDSLICFRNSERMRSHKPHLPVLKSRLIIFRSRRQHSLTSRLGTERHIPSVAINT